MGARVALAMIALCIARDPAGAQRPEMRGGTRGCDAASNMTPRVGVMGEAAMGGEMSRSAGLVPPELMTGRAGARMLSYQYMTDRMRGNRDGRSDVSDGAVLQRFASAPTDMSMQMHMGMGMYAVTDRVTVMAVVPVLVKSMNHVAQDGTRFNERSTGISDVELHGLYALCTGQAARHRVLLNAGLGLPTGDINRSMNGMRLEYPMQPGSGTWSLMPGVSYVGLAPPLGWGAQFRPTIRLGRNANGYALGNRYQSSAWLGRQLNPSATVSMGIAGDWWQNVRGADLALDPLDEPTKDASRQGGKRIDLVPSITLHPATGLLQGQQLFVHAFVPITQSLNGPQLQRRWALQPGWSWEF